MIRLRLSPKTVFLIFFQLLEINARTVKRYLKPTVLDREQCLESLLLPQSLNIRVKTEAYSFSNVFCKTLLKKVKDDLRKAAETGSPKKYPRE